MSTLKANFIDNAGKILIDEPNANLMYIGLAETGSDESAPVWCIRKVTVTGGNYTEVLFANGDARFTQVWNDRATYSYS